jgi:hypothetical protein
LVKLGLRTAARTRRALGVVKSANAQIGAGSSVGQLDPFLPIFL